MSRLHVFIDESRIPDNQGSPFFAGAVWCAPRPTIGVPKTLKPTILSMKQTLEGILGHPVDEVKYSHGAGRYAKDLLSVGFMETERDDTISARNLLVPAHGVGFTTAIVDGLCETCFARGTFASSRPNPDLGNQIRARAVGLLLQPILRYESELDLAVILDGANWKPSVEHYFGKNLEKLVDSNRMKCQIEYGDSKRVPGLQFADLVAGTLRDHVTNSENEDAYNMIMKRGIHRLGRVKIKGVEPLKT